MVTVTVWWFVACLIHHSFLNPSETIISEKYAQQISEMHWKLHLQQLALINRKDPILLHNAWPHVTQPTLQKLNELGYDVLPHLQHSSNLSTTDYHFFKHIDFLQGKCFHNQQETENVSKCSSNPKAWIFMLLNKVNLFHKGKNVLTVKVAILINKGVFEPSYVI